MVMKEISFNQFLLCVGDVILKELIVNIFHFVHMRWSSKN